MIPKFPLFLTLILGGISAWLWLDSHCDARRVRDFSAAALAAV